MLLQHGSHSSHSNHSNHTNTINHLNVNGTDTGSPQSLTWNEWSGDNIGPVGTHVDYTIDKIKEIRENITAIQTNKGPYTDDIYPTSPYFEPVNPTIDLSGVADSTFDPGDEIMDEQYDALKESIERLYLYITETNVIDTSWISVGGSLPADWIYNGTSTQTTLASMTGPYGETVTGFYIISDGTAGSNGGFDTKTYPIVPTSYNTSAGAPSQISDYRFSAWIKKDNNLTDGTIYIGTQPIITDSTGDNTNHFFWSGQLPIVDTWYLFIGYASAAMTTGDILDTSGSSVATTGYAYLYDNYLDQIAFRIYLNGSSVSGANMSILYPRIDKVTGDEPTIAELLAGPPPYGTGTGLPDKNDGDIILKPDFENIKIVTDDTSEYDASAQHNNHHNLATHTNS